MAPGPDGGGQGGQVGQERVLRKDLAISTCCTEKEPPTPMPADRGGGTMRGCRLGSERWAVGSASQ